VLLTVVLASLGCMVTLRRGVGVSVMS